MTQAPAVESCLRDGEARLRDAKVPDARAEAEFLLASILGAGRAALRLDGGRALNAAQTRRWRALLSRRLRREPLAYILGTQPFHDIELTVRPGVFIPRPETEELVEAVIKAVSALNRTPSPLVGEGRDGGKSSGGSVPPPQSSPTRGEETIRILDLCTGSGAIALALAKHLPRAQVWAVEKSPAAFAAARANGRGLRLGVHWLRGDLFAPLAGRRFDVIASNPPYVRAAAIPRLSPEVRKEPRLALDGGARGLDVLSRIVSEAAAHLQPGGMIFLEMDPVQTRTVASWLRRADFHSVEIKKDMQGRGRIVMGRHG